MTSPTDPSPFGTDTADPTLPSAPDGGTAEPPAPPPGVPDAGRPDVDAPTPTCTPEAEPNNDLAHATAFTGSLCGKIAGTSDVDFGRFVVPRNAKTMAITHAESGGKLNYRYYLNGQLIPRSESIGALPGATYTVQIKRANGNGSTSSYRLDVTFK